MKTSTSPTPLRRVRVHCLMPLWFRASVIQRDNLTGTAVELEVIWASRGRWQRWRAKHDTARLNTFGIGPFVLAVGLN